MAEEKTPLHRVTPLQRRACCRSEIGRPPVRTLALTLDHSFLAHAVKW
jgi:hypothetical protein